MKKILLMAFALLVLNACGNKESYVKDFSDFVEDVRAHADSYSEKDWEKADKKFEKFTGDIYEKFAEELTAEENMEIAKYQTAYSALRVKAGFKDFGKDIEEAAQKAKEALEGK